MGEVLLELAERVEALTGPSYDVECAIWDAIYPGERQARFDKLCREGPYKGRLGPADMDGYVKPYRAFTSSLDAAMTLVPEAWDWCLSQGCDEPAMAALAPAMKVAETWGAGDNPALALCSAALKARATLAQKGGA